MAGSTKSLLVQVTITPHRSGARGHSDHGWLNTYHSFSFADWPSRFPAHPHRNFEIFSYILSGELTHRDSMVAKGNEGAQSDKFYRMRRGDVQFTTGGTGIAHSETNEHETVHFLQIWAVPWKRGLAPRYHTKHFGDEDKRRGFVTILSPLRGGQEASGQEEEAAEATVAGSIPIHADLAMGAGLIAPHGQLGWIVGAGATKEPKRNVYVHLPMTNKGRARVRLDLDDCQEVELAEGDGAFVDGVSAGDLLVVEGIGEVEAEVIVLDSA